MKVTSFVQNQLMISNSLSYSSAYMSFYKIIICLEKMQSLTWSLPVS